ncbi:MAG: hypothetical protein A2Z35_04055 [Actinobacteria bacterium RBG_19FT_COMBO_36_27]|nr:MAG: hypothetical protein A2Z35_04055 [Actinobacteria bacterium RBG_19FT_COMBO_36_27]
MVGSKIPLNINKRYVVITERLPDLGIRMKGVLNFNSDKKSPLKDKMELIALEKRCESKIRFTISQTLHGNCLIGRSGENTKNAYNRNVDYFVIKTILSRAIRFITILKSVKYIRIFAGLRPYSIDRKPLMRTILQSQRFIVATGHGDKGIGWMSNGKLLVDYLLDRKSFTSIEPFMSNRIEN